MNTNNPNDNPNPNANPYTAQMGEDQRNLDAGAPQLRSEENQRLDRRALAFLGGTAALLIALGAWAVITFSSGEEKKEEPEPVAQQQSVSVPDVPAMAFPPPPQNEPVAQPVEEDVDAIAIEDDRPPPIQYAQSSQPSEPVETPAQKRRRLLIESRIAGARADVPEEAVAAVGTKEASKATASVRRLQDPDTLMVRGTYIRCILETRIITDVSGFTSCLVTEPVYSINGRRLLLSKGSKISGQYASGAITGKRVAILWDRVTTPNGLDVDLGSPGIDNLGGAGHPGNYSAHWGKRITSALMISLLSDAFKFAGEKYGPRRQTLNLSNPGTGLVYDEPFESNTAEAMQELATRAIEENFDQPPTVTINQGSLLNIYVAKDINFSEVL